MLRLNKFEKIVRKMGKMEVKREDFRLCQCSKKEKPLIHPKDCQKFPGGFISGGRFSRGHFSGGHFS